MIEIERKFLVNSNDFKLAAFKKTRISQGFLNTNKVRTVRVRLKGELGYVPNRLVQQEGTNEPK